MQDTRETIGKLVRLFHEKNVKAIVAGGAARDIFNGHPVKDIDVFVIGGWNMAALAEHVFGIEVNPFATVDLPWTLVGGSEYIPLFRARGVLQVNEMMWEGEMLNFIFMQSDTLRQDIVDRFDLASNQAWFSYNPTTDRVTLQVTEGFLHDHALHRMTVNHCVSAVDAKRTWKRYQRLSEQKYRGYKLNVPGEFYQMFPPEAHGDCAWRGNA